MTHRLLTNAAKKHGLAIAFIAAMTACTGICYPQTVTKKEPVTVDEIRPAPSFDIKEINFRDSVTRQFKLTGTLDAVYADRVVVDDTSLPIKNGLSVKGVAQGQRVGVVIDKKGKVTDIQPLSGNDYP